MGFIRSYWVLLGFTGFAQALIESKKLSVIFIGFFFKLGFSFIDRISSTSASSDGRRDATDDAMVRRKQPETVRRLAVR